MIQAVSAEALVSDKTLMIASAPLAKICIIQQTTIRGIPESDGSQDPIRCKTMTTFVEEVGDSLWIRANAGLLTAKELMVWVEHFLMTVQEPLIQNWVNRDKPGPITEKP